MSSFETAWELMKNDPIDYTTEDFGYDEYFQNLPVRSEVHGKDLVTTVEDKKYRFPNFTTISGCDAESDDFDLRVYNAHVDELENEAKHQYVKDMNMDR